MYIKEAAEKLGYFDYLQKEYNKKLRKEKS